MSRDVKRLENKEQSVTMERLKVHITKTFHPDKQDQIFPLPFFQWLFQLQNAGLFT